MSECTFIPNCKGCPDCLPIQSDLLPETRDVLEEARELRSLWEAEKSGAFKDWSSDLPYPLPGMTEYAEMVGSLIDALTESRAEVYRACAARAYALRAERDEALAEVERTVDILTRDDLNRAAWLLTGAICGWYMDGGCFPPKIVINLPGRRVSVGIGDSVTLHDDGMVTVGVANEGLLW